MKGRKEVTIYDIAKVLNLSASTVSRALSGNPAIKKDTIRRIKETAVSMGYQQNTFASNLRKRRSNTIGVILPRLDSNFQSAVVSGIEKKVSQNGFNLIISQSLESVDKEIANTTTMFNSRVDGLLISLACDTCNLNHLDKFLKKDIPVIFFDRVMEHPKYQCSRVVIDNVKAGFDATSHLIEQGCERIMYVSDNLLSSVYADRQAGYKKALKHHRLAFDPELTFVTPLDEGSGERTYQRLLAYKDRPDGIFAANDTSAVALICALKKAGLKIPEDVAVVGFNNVNISRIIDPSLTTIHYPGVEMGEAAAETLIEMLASEGPVVTKTVVLDHQLIIRNSSLRRQSQANAVHPSSPGGEREAAYNARS